MRAGIARGIDTVFQELSLLPDLSVAENVFFQREPRSRLGLVDQGAAIRQTRDLFGELEVEGIAPSAKVGALPVAQQQMVEIVKVVARKPRIIVLDEPTASLSRQASLWLFALIRRLTDEGAAVVFISHRIREAFEIADRITVFRNSRTVSSGPVSAYTEASLVEAMLGRRLIESYMEARPALTEEVALEVRDLGYGRRFHDVSFSVRRGEIFGLGGLHGQGQYDLLQALYGWNHPRGEVRLGGEPVRLRSPKDALRHGVALIPEDRRTEGLMMALPIRENLTLPIIGRLTRLGIISLSREQTAAREIAERFSIRAPSLEHEVQALSGGNQQKVLVGKLLSSGVRVLLLADVTRGIDVGTRADMYALVRDLAASGVAIVLYSSDSSSSLPCVTGSR